MSETKCCNRKCGLICSMVVGAILIIIGGISIAVFNIFFNKILIQEGQIEEGNTMYDAWSEVTSPTYMSYYFYNVTNAEEFLAQTTGNYVPPVLEELGPYTFREYLKKDHISFLGDLEPEEVFYRQTTKLYFDPENSKGTLDDNITTINIIGATIVPILEYQLKQLGQTPSKIIYRTLNNLYKDAGTELLFTHTAHDILFGFEDPLYKSIVDLFSNLGIPIPDTYGLFSTSNTSAGWFDYTVYTGKEGHPELINVITSYRNETMLDYWNATECNMLNGTDGTTTPPFMEKEDKVYFFVDDLCRSLYSVFDSEVTIERIPGWKFVVPPDIFQAPHKNSDNECYCPRPNNPVCDIDGGLLIEACMGGAPVLISSPHFLYGDGHYFSQSKGLAEPNKDEHEAALVYEPNTGIAIKADKRLQINIMLSYNENNDLLSIIEGYIAFPVLWLNESATIGRADADLLYGLLIVPREVVSILQIILCVVGALLFIAPIIYILVIRSSDDDDVNKGGKMFETTQVKSKHPTITRFSSRTNDVFTDDSGNTKADPNKSNHDERFTSTTSKSELIYENARKF